MRQAICFGVVLCARNANKPMWRVVGQGAINLSNNTVTEILLKAHTKNDKWLIVEVAHIRGLKSAVFRRNLAVKTELMAMGSSLSCA